MNINNNEPDLKLVSNGEANEEIDEVEEFVAPSLGIIEDNKNTFVSDSSIVIENDEETEGMDEERLLKLCTYTCKTCGNKIVTSFYTSISTCVFCGSGQIFKDDDLDTSKLHILPFLDSLGDAKKDFKKRVMFNPLIPNVFRKKKTINKMKKVYVGCKVYDLDVSGSVTFTAADKIKNIKNAPMQGFECKYSTSFNFTNLVNCSCSNISDESFSTIGEYNFSIIEEFNPSYLRDALFTYPDEDKEANLEKIKDRVTKLSLSIVRETITHDLKKVKDNSLKFDIKSNREVLLPVYLLNVKYKGKNYMYIRNGQTGKVSIDVAYEKKNLIVFGLVLYVLLFILLLVLSFLF